MRVRGRKFTFVLWNCRSDRVHDERRRRAGGRARVSSCRCRYIGPCIMHNIKTFPVVSRRAFNRVSLLFRLPATIADHTRVATSLPSDPACTWSRWIKFYSLLCCKQHPTYVSANLPFFGFLCDWRYTVNFEARETRRIR